MNPIQKGISITPQGFTFQGDKETTESSLNNIANIEKILKDDLPYLQAKGGSPKKLDKELVEKLVGVAHDNLKYVEGNPSDQRAAQVRFERIINLKKAYEYKFARQDLMRTVAKGAFGTNDQDIAWKCVSLACKENPERALQTLSLLEGREVNFADTKYARKAIEDVNLAVFTYLVEHNAGIPLEFLFGPKSSEDKYNFFLVLARAKRLSPEWRFRVMLRLFREGNKDMALRFFNAGVDVNAKDNIGNTLLHYAVIEHKKSLDIIEFFLEHGADPRIPNHAGETPIHEAVRLGRRDILRLFNKQKLG